MKLKVIIATIVATLALFGCSGGSADKTWSSHQQDRLLNICRDAGHTQSDCLCIINETQRQYTYGEFVDLGNSASNRLADDVVKECG